MRRFIGVPGDANVMVGFDVTFGISSRPLRIYSVEVKRPRHPAPTYRIIPNPSFLEQHRQLHHNGRLRARPRYAVLVREAPPQPVNQTLTPVPGSTSRAPSA